jgi:putative PIN family toxin of toxin-antitoxin system
MKNTLVLDTNIVLDLYVFKNPETVAINIALMSEKSTWLSTQSMRDELERVLYYPKIIPRMTFYQVTAEQVLAKFDEFATLVAPAPRAQWVCKDTDDQKFIDLAVQHQATLLSKDQAVLCMAKRLLTGGVKVQKNTVFQ